ncbi:MAG: hypothetical protein ACPGED_12130, partial [Flavobacteriales bacterium]
NNNIVQTQVYTMQGLLIGEGQEEVYNPSGLMWFQNIELTALNSAAVTAKQQQDVSRMTASNEPFIFPGGRRHPMALSFEPALVEYRKLGDWKFYPVYNYSFDEGTESLELSSELLSERFPSMDLKTIDSVVRYGELGLSGELDSLDVVYEQNAARHILAFSEGRQLKLGLIYYPSTQGIQLINNPSEALPAGLHKIGRIDNQNRMIGMWKHFTNHGVLLKKEEFFVATKEEELIVLETH